MELNSWFSPRLDFIVYIVEIMERGESWLPTGNIKLINIFNSTYMIKMHGFVVIAVKTKGNIA